MAEEGREFGAECQTGEGEECGGDLVEGESEGDSQVHDEEGEGEGEGEGEYASGGDSSDDNSSSPNISSSSPSSSDDDDDDDEEDDDAQPAELDMISQLIEEAQKAHISPISPRALSGDAFSKPPVSEEAIALVQGSMPRGRRAPPRAPPPTTPPRRRPPRPP